MTPDFEISALQSFLGRGLGWDVKSLSLLPVCNQALNFKAVRASDDFAFLVKLLPISNDSRFKNHFDNLSRHLEDLTGTKAVRSLFPDGPNVFKHYRLRYLSWCEGSSLDADQLTDDALRNFVAEYLVLSRGMQKTSAVLPPRNFEKWRAEIRRGLRGFWGMRLLQLVEAEFPSRDSSYEPSCLKVIHGDLHSGNFLFSQGCVTGFFDLEEFRWGYPAEDIVRYVSCSADHLFFFSHSRRRRLLLAFEKMVTQLPFPEHEWRVAICGLFLYRLVMHVRRGCGQLAAANLLFRSRFYRELLLIVERHFSHLRRDGAD